MFATSMQWGPWAVAEQAHSSILEQPRKSRMWSVVCLRRFIRLAAERGFDVAFVDVDKCRFGLVDPVTGRAFKKATRFLVSRPGRRLL